MVVSFTVMTAADGLNHHQRVLDDVELHADAFERAVQVLHRAFHVFCLDVRRVWVELLQHAFDGRVHHLLLGEGVDIEVADEELGRLDFLHLRAVYFEVLCGEKRKVEHQHAEHHGQILADVLAVVQEFADDAAAHGGMFGRGEQQDGVDAGELAVHIGHVAFILHVFHVADAAQQGRRTHFGGEVGGESFVTAHGDAGFVVVDALDLCLTFLDAEHPFLLGMHADGDDDLGTHRQGAVHNVLVSDGEGVERAGEQPFMILIHLLFLLLCRRRAGLLRYGGCR